MFARLQEKMPASSFPSSSLAVVSNNGLPVIGFQSVGLPAAIGFQSARTYWPLV
jgi:hypothetical protein